MVDARAFPRATPGAGRVVSRSGRTGMLGIRVSLRHRQARRIDGFRRLGRRAVQGWRRSRTATAPCRQRRAEFEETHARPRPRIRRGDYGLSRHRHRRYAQERLAVSMTRPGRPKLSASTDPGPWFLDFAKRTDPIDFAELFGNGAPVELEIGCGRGMF